MKKLAVVLMLAVVFTMTLTGCSKDKGNQETTTGQVDLSSNSEVAINAGGIGVLTGINTQIGEYLRSSH